MKEQFIKKRFGAEASAMIQTVNGILTEYVDAGYDLSLRQLYYQLVSRNIVENTERSYKNGRDYIAKMTKNYKPYRPLAMKGQ